MAGKDPNVKVKVTAQNDTGKGLKQAEAEVKTFASNVSSIVKGAFAFAAAGAVGGLFKAAIAESAQAQKSFNYIGQALTNIGVSAEKVRPEIEGVIGTLSKKIGIDDDEIKLAFAGLVTRTGDYHTALKALPTVIDVAKARNLDLGKASDLTAKALAGNETALKKLGVTVKDTETPFDALRRTFNGFAEADANTFTGALDRIGVAWKSDLQTLGDVILGTQDVGENTNWFIDVLAKLEGFITENQQAIQDMTTVVMELGKGIVTLAGWIGTVLVRAFQGAELVVIDVVAGFQMIPAGLKLALGASIETLVGWADKVESLLGKLGINFGEGVIDNVRQFSQRLIKEATTQIKELETARIEAGDSVFASGEPQVKKTPTFKVLPSDGTLGKDSVTKNTKDKEKDPELARLNKMVTALDDAIGQGRLNDAEVQKALEATITDLEEELALNGNSFERETALYEMQNKIGKAIGGVLTKGKFVPEQPKEETPAQNYATGLDKSGIKILAEGSGELTNLLDTTNALKESIGELSGESLNVLGSGFANLFVQVGAGVFAFQNLGKAIRQSLAQAAIAEAQDSVARGIKALAQGLITNDPKAFAAAGQYFASAAAFGVLGGMIGGSSVASNNPLKRGYDQPGGGSSNTFDNSLRGDATIVISGGLLDMTDPKQARALADAINQLNGRRVTITN